MVGDFFYVGLKTLGGRQWHTIVIFSPHGEMGMVIPISLWLGTGQGHRHSAIATPPPQDNNTIEPY